MKKFLVLLLAVCFAVAMFAGCKPTQGSDDPSGKPQGQTPIPVEELKLNETTLKWVVIGDKGVDHSKIWKLIDEKTMAMPNVKAKVEFIFCSWGDYQNTYPLKMSSGEDIDMFYVSEWVKYSNHARKNAFQEISMEMLEKYAPNVAENTPQIAWDQVKVDGKIYMVPAVQDEFADGNLCFMLRGDFMKEFGMTSVSTQAEFEQYLTQVKQKHPEVIPWNGGDSFVGCFFDAIQSTKSWGSLLPMSYLSLKDKTEDAKVYGYMQDNKDAFLKALADSKSWVQKGFWSSSLLSKTTLTHDEYIAGTTAMCTQNILTLTNYYNMVLKDNPSYEPYIGTFAPDDAAIYRTGFNNNGTAIALQCKQPERVLLWLDAVLYTQELNDLVLLGIEGSHWILNDDDTTATGPDASNLSSYSCWGLNTYECKRLTPRPQVTTDVLDFFTRNVSKNLALYMTFDTSKYANELAAMTGIQTEMQKTLFAGLYDDPAAKAEEYMNKLKNAGWDKMYAEYQSQLETYVASLK